MITIIPAILTANQKDFELELSKVWRVTPRVHLDVIDGEFAETVTVGPEVIRTVDTIVRFDAHLMVNQPEDWIGRCAANGFDRVYGQIERMSDPVKFIADAQFEGLEVGLAYDIETGIVGLEKYVNDLDSILLMSVKAGAQGRTFDEKVFEKIREVRSLDKMVTIVVDGGLDEKRIRDCLIAEWAQEIKEEALFKTADRMEFVVGSHLYKAENIEEEFDNLRLLKKENHG